jgi:hypothetical protein
LRCASKALAVVLIFKGRPAEGAVGFRALGELFAVAAVDMEGPAARGRAPWTSRRAGVGEGASCGGKGGQLAE